MPRRDDLKRIVILGAGPIVIGQACEFDYSGTQGTKALREEGYDVILVNSNPATIMTDPELAARTYVEPLEARTLTAILERERPSAILPTLGGQTALNLALDVHRDGTLARLGIEMLGASPLAIAKAEDRALFKDVVTKVGLESPRSEIAHTVDEAWDIVRRTGFPAILRPSFTLAGSGGGIAYDESELATKVAWALDQSPVHEVLIEESLLGWKEFELEVMRDRKDNFIVVCTIENIDPMGVHTGDSITVAPAMTLTDREYQRLRDGARAIMTEIGVETGGANVQFAVSPRDGRVRVIEMNPRVSRSSALASKATGYPIAKIAAKLAVGYTLDELRNDITSRRLSEDGTTFTLDVSPGAGTSAAFEPTIDYVVVKWPRFAFEKFPGADETLGPQMKSVGEVMSIGGTFCHALQKAARSLETGRDGLVSLLGRVDYRLLARPKKARDLGMDAPSLDRAVVLPPATPEELVAAVRTMVARPLADRLFYVADAMRLGVTDAEIGALTAIDPWFLGQVRRIVDAERALSEGGAAALRDPGVLLRYKKLGFSDAQIATHTGGLAADVRAQRSALGLAPAYARVDTCSAEFVARRRTSTRRTAAPTSRRRPAAARSSSWAAGRTVSVRASSSTTAACTRCRRFAASGSRPSWSTATRRRSRPTTTPRTSSTSSRSRSRTSCRCATSRSRSASSSSSAARRRSSSRSRSRSGGSGCSGRRRTRLIAPRTAAASTSCSPSSVYGARAAGRPAAPRRPSPSPIASAIRCSSGRATCSEGAR